MTTEELVDRLVADLARATGRTEVTVRLSYGLSTGPLYPPRPDPTLVETTGA